MMTQTMRNPKLRPLAFVKPVKRIINDEKALAKMETSISYLAKDTMKINKSRVAIFLIP